MATPSYVKRDDMGFVYIGLTALAIGMCVWFWYTSHTDIVYYGLKFAWHQLSMLDYSFMPGAIKEWKAELATLAAAPADVSFDDFLAAMNKVGYLFVWIPILLTIRGILMASKHKANLTRRKVTIRSLPWIMSQHSPAIIPTLYYGDKDSLLLNVDPEEHRSAINPEEWVQQNGLLVNGALDRNKCRALFIEHLGARFAPLDGEQEEEQPEDAATVAVHETAQNEPQTVLPVTDAPQTDSAPEPQQPEPAPQQTEEAQGEAPPQAQGTTAPMQLELALPIPEDKPEQQAQPETEAQEAKAEAQPRDTEAKPEEQAAKPTPKPEPLSAPEILTKMQPQEKAMFAIFGSRLFRRDNDTEKATAQDLLDSLNRSCHQGKGYPDLTITDKAFAQYVAHPDVPAWLKKHAYPRTLLHAMHKEALHTGKLPSSHFRWLKGMDRGLWYALNTTGRKTPFLESAAVYTQTLWEDFAHEQGQHLTEPFVDDAIDGLEAYLVKIGLLRRSKESAT